MQSAAIASVVTRKAARAGRAKRWWRRRLLQLTTSRTRRAATAAGQRTARIAARAMGVSAGTCAAASQLRVQPPPPSQPRPPKPLPTPKATTTNNNGLPSFAPGQLPQFNPFREPWETPGGSAVGPVPLAVKDHPKAGWVVEHDDAHAPDVVAGAVRIAGNSQAYLVNDHTPTTWKDHGYARLDLRSNPLSFTLDLSQVPCGCFACVYLVAMKDPSEEGI